MLTKHEILRERYEARQMAIRDLLSELDEAREEGLEKGLENGILIERVRFAEQILNQTVTPEDQLKTLSIQRLQELAEQLKSAVLDR